MRLKRTKLLLLLRLFLLSMAVMACTSLFDKEDNKSETADIYLQLGVRYIELNKLEIAKENLQIALEKDPNNAQAHNANAYLYEKLHDYPKAKQNYQLALELAPDAWSIQNNYGRFLCEQGDHQQGLQIMMRAFTTQLNDKAWLALTNAGRCQLQAHDKSSAKHYFERALILNAVYAPALIEMQSLSFEAGDYLAAQAYFKRYVDVEAVTPASLWIARQTELALGHALMAQEDDKLLLDKFPLSEEAKKIKPVLQ